MGILLAIHTIMVWKEMFAAAAIVAAVAYLLWGKPNAVD